MSQACLATARRTDGTLLSFPLKVAPKPKGLVQEATEFNADLIKGLIPKLDWAALRKTAGELGVAALPETIPEGAIKDEGFLKSVHQLIMDVRATNSRTPCSRNMRISHSFLLSSLAFLELLTQIHLQEGTLVCPNCGRVYPVTKGIPNMLLAEDEV